MLKLMKLNRKRLNYYNSYRFFRGCGYTRLDAIKSVLKVYFV